MTAKVAAILEQAKSLTREERAELEAALHASNENEAKADAQGPSLLGMFADEPEVIDEVMEEVRRARATWKLRDPS